MYAESDIFKHVIGSSS